MAETREGLPDGRKYTGVLAKVPPHVAEMCHENQGVLFPMFMSPKCLDDLKNFKIRDDDIFVITYPKSGTTWAQMIALLVKFDGEVSRMDGKFIMELIPFLETLALDLSKITDPSTLQEQIDNSPTVSQVAGALPTDSIRILKTHCLPKFLPDDISSDDPKTKVIYVARNPKDAAVSYYHFSKYLISLPNYASWAEYFETFINDAVPQGSWFENVLHWWNLRDHPNVLFLTYEGMKQDERKAVEQIAQFMGSSFSADVIDKIVASSKFDAMKNSRFANPDLALKGLKCIDTSEKKSFYRKGAIGDWKNYFTVEQNERFDIIYQEKMAGTGLEMIFE